MIIVDSHCHAGQNWFEPVEQLLHQMNINGVDKAILTQHGGSHDNSYLFECARRFPGRFAVVVLIDSSKLNALDILERCAIQGAAGVRLGPTVRSPGPDPLAIWRKAGELGLAVTCKLGTLKEFASSNFARLVAELPDVPIIMEHLAAAKQDPHPPYNIYKRVLDLAEYPSTYIKVGGLGEISHRPPVLQSHFAFDYTPPFIDMAYEAFGPERMMWGSDYPPVSSREGYQNAVTGVMEHPGLGTQQDREWIMGKTALSLFKFE